MATLVDIIEKDSWLGPHRDKLDELQSYIDIKSANLLGKKDLGQFALGHLYFGLKFIDNQWVLREWAPNATSIYLVCDGNGWSDQESFKMTLLDHGQWEIKMPAEALKHGDKYKLHIYWPGGEGYRIPSYAEYVVQDPASLDFAAEVWRPASTYSWRDKGFKPSDENPLIYEAHIGMSGDRKSVSTYQQFEQEVLPRVHGLGYNTIQLMAIQEHPYYGSFGYHVSNYFAASSRFGTPDMLKSLIDKAHSLGISVIMDIVHSHAVKNEAEGLSRFDGSYNQYFHSGERGHHLAWDSRVFDYGKPQVLHFLLSNLRYWIDEFHFDGFRFDGVTSMLYTDHGLGRDFSSYDDYFVGLDKDALVYLYLANRLVHGVKPDSITVAEDMSAFPGLAASEISGGIGFDYRLSMGTPDLWIKTLKEKRDEEWDIGHLFHELTAHRPEEQVISYAESHDQALVGDKTIIFRLIDQAMYWNMQVDDTDITVERGIALHKIIRLMTASTNGGGYLNFMGNEFGHPEWIDFPREGNGWSYDYARRQWSLVDDLNLKYKYLNDFDKAMLKLVRQIDKSGYHWVNVNQERRILSYMRGGHLYVFNLSPAESYVDLQIPAAPGVYGLELSSDALEFGGQDRVDKDIDYRADESGIKIYSPARTALVFELKN